MSLNIPNTIANEQEADGDKLGQNFDAIEVWADGVEANDWVTTARIDDGAVTKAKLAGDAVDGSKIANDAVDSEHIASGAIDNDHLAANSVTWSKILDETITGGKMVDGTITATKLGSNSVTTAKILNSNVTTAKIDDDAVTDAKIGAPSTGSLDSGFTRYARMGNIVHVWSTAYTNLGTLPAGFRPAATVRVPAYPQSGGLTYVEILTTGVMSYVGSFPVLFSASFSTV